MEALREVVPEGTPPADLAFGDARRLDVEPVQLVVTSPPYPSTYDYLPLQHLRHVWLPDPQPPFELEIGPAQAQAVENDVRRREAQPGALGWDAYD